MLLTKNKFQSVSKQTTNLTFIILLVDEFAPGKPIIEPVQLKLIGFNLKPIKKNNNSYLFLNFPDGTHKVQIEAKYYFPTGWHLSASAYQSINLVFPLPADEALYSPYF